MSDAIEEFFKRSNKYNRERKETLTKWRNHHESCVRDINNQLNELDRLPTSFEEIQKEYSNKKATE